MNKQPLGLFTVSFLCKNLLKFFINVYVLDSIDQSEVRFFELGSVRAAEQDHKALRPPP